MILTLFQYIYIVQFIEKTDANRTLLWDSFISMVKSEGGSEIVALYNDAYERSKEITFIGEL